MCGEGTNNDWLPGQHFIYQLILHWAHLFRNSAIKQKYLERRKFCLCVFQMILRLVSSILPIASVKVSLYWLKSVVQVSLSHKGVYR